MQCRIDPVSRYVEVTYAVPGDAPDALIVRAEWKPVGADAFQAVEVWTLTSETAPFMTPGDAAAKAGEAGRILERSAAGLERSLVWNPFGGHVKDGRLEGTLRVTLADEAGAEVASYEASIEAVHSDVVVLADWTGVMQDFAVTTEPTEGAWLAKDEGLLATEGIELPQLTYPLDCRGWYAVFVRTIPGKGGIELRLTGHERPDFIDNRYTGREALWQWARMDRQHLVIRQPHAYTGPAAGSLARVRLVPLTQAQVEALEAPYAYPADKTVVAYWEPYSWAFGSDIQSPLQHREPLSAYKEGRMSVVDMQVGRVGAKCVFESRIVDQLTGPTIGDPIGDVRQPRTDNVGRMQQYTNTLDATLRYGREMGLNISANYGAGNAYPHSPLHGDLTRGKEEWRRGSAPRWEVPEVREHVLAVFREFFEIGARAVSIDFCRYPEVLDCSETGTSVLRELRAMADEVGRAEGTSVVIGVRFPGTGVRHADKFDYAAWAKEGLVDCLYPSNIQGRHLHIDPAPYVEAVQGTKTQVLPSVDALSWGLPKPGLFLWRVHDLYEKGLPGIHVYQADAPLVHGPPEHRRMMRLLASSEAVRQYWEADAQERPGRSKGIYISGVRNAGAWPFYQRLRVWLEGLEWGPLEFYLDGELVNACSGPPYVLGGEDREHDTVVPEGEHELRIRVRDGESWFEETFTVLGAER